MEIGLGSIHSQEETNVQYYIGIFYTFKIFPALSKALDVVMEQKIAAILNIPAFNHHLDLGFAQVIASPCGF